VVPLDPAGAPATSDALAPPTPAEAPLLQLVLDRRRRLLRVVVDGRTLRRYPVAVGRPGWETPVGQFSVLEKQVQPVWEHPVSGLRIGPGPANPLGSRWIGFQRDCRGRRGFQGARPVVLRGCIVAGFHGTPNRGSIGRASSHGCVRLYEEDVRELFELVHIGTPVMVLP
jgi:lipoprotein-anchoring transpeptidase ErfK/SrfK